MDKTEPKSKQIVVFGAGIAGLTLAHELALRGHCVTVFESNAEAGGFFRSARRGADANTPSEYSWHGIGPWYHNAFDIMRQIPFDEHGSLYDRALSRPIDFGLAAEDGEATFDDAALVNIKGMFRMTWLDVIRGSWLMVKSWVADRRSVDHYSKINAACAWKPLLSDRCWRIWRSSFGPWIGSDWLNVSLHTAGKFFCKQLICKPSHLHSADEEGPSWWHGARSGWLLLRGPSNEFWIDPWVRYLRTLGVTFAFDVSLCELVFNGKRITGARLSNSETVDADIFALAANPFAVAGILERTPELQRQAQLQLFRPLVEQGPHTQVSLRIAFSEKIAWPRKRAGIIVASSEFDLTLFAQEQAWHGSVDIGEGVRSLWTVTACVSKEPGRLFGLPLERCTKDQFIEEVKAQLFACSGLDAMIRQANKGRSLKDFEIRHIEVWHEWEFSPEGIHSEQPKWVNRTNNQQYLPTQRTPVPNLILAGAHTATDVDVWSIEAAVESGRRAAQIIEPDVRVLPQFRPVWIRVLQGCDNLLYSIGAPNVLDVGLVTALLVGLVGLLWLLFVQW